MAAFEIPRNLNRLLIAAVAVGVAAPAIAQERIPDAFRHFLRQGGWQEKYLADVMVAYRQADRDRDGLDAKDLEFARRFVDIQRRTEQVRLMISKDLDGDGRVSDEEIGTVVREQMRRRGVVDRNNINRSVAREVQRIMALDRNKDRTVDMDEVLNVTEAPDRAGRDYQLRAVEHLMTLDPDKDGVLTEAEFKRVAIDVFRRVDRNDDRLIDGKEYRAYYERHRPGAKPVAAPCDLPKAGGGDKVVLVGIHRGSAVASVSIGGPEYMITAQNVVIESGDAPLYLVLNGSQRMIWNLTGAVERVSRAVVIQRHQNYEQAGVVGLAPNKVTFLPAGSCNSWFNQPGGGQARLAATRIGNTLDRPIEGLIGVARYNVGAVHLPSGRQDMLQQPVLTPEQKDGPVPERVLREVWRHAPAGYVSVDLEDLVASDKVRSVSTRPGVFGILDLLESGHLRRLSDGMLEILKPIDWLPAELPGAYRRFIVPDGMPLPKNADRNIRFWSKEKGTPRALE